MKAITGSTKKKIPRHPFRRTPGEASKEPLKLDDKKNHHPFVEAPNSGHKSDPESSKSDTKAYEHF